MGVSGEVNWREWGTGWRGNFPFSVPVTFSLMCVYITYSDFLNNHLKIKNTKFPLAPCCLQDKVQPFSLEGCEIMTQTDLVVFCAPSSHHHLAVQPLWTTCCSPKALGPSGFFYMLLALYGMLPPLLTAGKFYRSFTTNSDVRSSWMRRLLPWMGLFNSLYVIIPTYLHSRASMRNAHFTALPQHGMSLGGPHCALLSYDS